MSGQDQLYMPTKVGISQEMGDHHKRGHTCCGCCCDTRRAVIIGNMFMLIFTVIAAIMIIIGVEVLKGNAALMDDDVAQQELNSIPLGLVVVVVMIQAILFVFVFGIMGAIKYTKWMIFVALIGYALAFVGNILQGNIPHIILAALFAYPHFMFISELNQGIMTPDNSPTRSIVAAVCSRENEKKGGVCSRC
jgi:hypothetical protein